MTERGAIYRMAERGAYTGKPRPVVVMQNPNVRLDSVIVVPLTSHDAEAEPIRIPIDPTPANGLGKRSYAMCDKIQAIRVSSLAEPPIGRLPGETLRQIQAVVHDLIDEGVSLD